MCIFYAEGAGKVDNKAFRKRVYESGIEPVCPNPDLKLVPGHFYTYGRKYCEEVAFDSRKSAAQPRLPHLFSTSHHPQGPGVIGCHDQLVK